MANFVQRDQIYVATAVGIVESVIVAPIDLTGHDYAIISIDPTSGDTFNGRAQSSPDGVHSWSNVPDDAFASVAVGTDPRRMTLAAKDHLFVRVVGNFTAVPGSVRISAVRLRAAARLG